MNDDKQEKKTSSGDRKKVTLGMVEEGIEMLKSLPPIDKNLIACTKAEAINQWSPYIQKAQENGYSLDQVVENLQNLGFEISTKNLKVYLSRAKRKQLGEKKTKAKKDTPAASTHPVSSFEIKEDSEVI